MHAIIQGESVDGSGNLDAKYQNIENRTILAYLKLINY